jgi:3-methyl-2-oxobutanoate hydroxymethyltransferase
VRAKEEDEANRLIEDAQLLERTGVFAIVLEKIPSSLAARVAQSVNVPIIGIGAGNEVDGQVLVSHDMFGMTEGFSPRFLRRYAHVGQEMSNAVKQYIVDVKDKAFPNASESY